MHLDISIFAGKTGDMMKLMTPRLVFLTVTIFVAALSRLLPHPPNFTAMGALALFGGALVDNRVWRYLLPLAALFISDLILNNVIYPPTTGFRWFTPGAAFIYGGFIAIVLLGQVMIRKVSAPRVLLASVSASTVFFLITNFGDWARGLYPQTAEGLLLCYEAGIPFFWNTLAGDLFFSTVLFGGYALAKMRFPQLARA